MFSFVVALTDAGKPQLWLVWIIESRSYPLQDALAGIEFQYGYRKNFRDGWSVPDYRIQLSFKYNFSFRIGG